jgi:maltose-binding protein MalE
MAKKLTGEMNGKQVYGYGTRATTSEQYLHFAWNYGAKLINTEDMSPATDSEAWAKGMEDYMAFYNAGVCPEGSGAMDATTLLNMFINGEIAMFLSAVDYTPTIKAEWAKEESPFAPENLAVAPLLAETYATTYTGADVLAVNAATKNVEATSLLVNYLMGAEAQATYCKNVGFFPGAKSAAEDSFFKDDPIQAGFAATMAGCHYFDNYGVPGVGTILKEEIQRLIAGECTIDEYQAAITERINAAIAEMDA